MTAVAAPVMALDDVTRALGRPIWEIPTAGPLRELAGKRMLVTGASGSLGDALVRVIPAVHRTDIDTLDVRSPVWVWRKFYSWKPDVVFHLAGAKHAPDGELNPAEVATTNMNGTLNVVSAASRVGARVVLASTCKACDPETVYGASKLIAERVVLQAGGTVARLFNVVETSGNVFETWRGLPALSPVEVSACRRYFLALQEAIALLMWCATLPSGRYAVDPRRHRKITDVANDLYPGRPQQPMEPRRGDRMREPLCGSSEHIRSTDQEWLWRIASPHEAAA